MEANTIRYFVKISTRSPHEIKSVSKFLYGSTVYLFGRFDTSLKVFNRNSINKVFLEFTYNLGTGTSEPLTVHKVEPKDNIRTPYTNEEQPLIILDYRSINNLKAVLTMFGL